MDMRVNAVTTDGEQVVIVEKEITDGARPFESQILTSEDGRKFKPMGGGQVVEITVMDVDETPAATVEETTAPDSEQAAEAPAEDGAEEADD